LIAEWLEAIEPVVSKGDWESCADRCGRLLLPYFKEVEAISTSAIEDYIAMRLQKVSRATVKKEVGVLRRFVKWAHRRGEIAEAVEVPNPPSRAKGTRVVHRPLVLLSDAQAEAIVAALPDRSPHGRPIKALFTILWDTGLRIEGVEKLSVPEHYEPSNRVLRVTEEIDKNGYGRDLPLTPRSRSALDSIIEGPGIIFGKYEYYKTLRRAARTVAAEIGLTDRQCGSLDARDFRHAATSDAAQKTRQLAGVSYLAGHRDQRTTSRYIHPTQDAGLRALKDRFPHADWQHEGAKWGTEWGTARPEKNDDSVSARDLKRTRRDSNPRLLPPQTNARATFPSVFRGFAIRSSVP
jgi:integrase